MRNTLGINDRDEIGIPQPRVNPQDRAGDANFIGALVEKAEDEAIVRLIANATADFSIDAQVRLVELARQRKLSTGPALRRKDFSSGHPWWKSATTTNLTTVKLASSSLGIRDAIVAEFERIRSDNLLTNAGGHLQGCLAK